MGSQTLYTFTDYPTHFATIDPDIGLAPLRQIKVLSYDGDKRCKIEEEGGTSEVKAGYIYTMPKNFPPRQIDPYRQTLNNRDYAAHRKALRKRHTEYFVFDMDNDDPAHERSFKTMKAAFRHMIELVKGSMREAGLRTVIQVGNGVSYMTLTAVTKHECVIMATDYKGNSIIKNAHFDKWAQEWLASEEPIVG